MQFTNGGILVQDLADLPDLTGATRLFADFETKSGSKKEKAVNPWRFCDILGVALTVDDNPNAWYVPVGHYDQHWNLPKEPVYRWWCEVLDSAESWVNHNVKFDAHVSTNWAGVMPADRLRLVDTMVLARLLNSDRIRYGLKVLSEDWLGHSIDKYNDVFEPYLYNNKDYGVIPGDLMGEYACQDVLTNRELYRYIDSRLPDSVRDIADTEIKLTRVLFDMERSGMQVTPDLKQVELRTLYRMLKLDEELAELVGRSFRPDSNPDCYEILCQQYGLPVLGWTDGKMVEGKRVKQPSFDKHAMTAYSAHPTAPQEVVQRIIEYRKLNTLMNFFIKPYGILKDEEDILHSNYTQCLRTGRMACKQPNSQQLSKDAKKLIVPGDGMSFLSVDYSQIEFRLMMHYIKDAAAIEAYKKDPDEDFHVLVAEWCEITRRPAKTVNFSIGFGMGRRNIVIQLAANKELVGPLKDEAERIALQMSGLEPGSDAFNDFRTRTFNSLAQQRGEAVFDKYHATFYTMKPTSKQAEEAAKRRGYVFTMYGRRRHLPVKMAFIAFNFLNQGTAADIMKERTVEIAQMLKGTPIEVVASVHDELLFRGPTKLIEDTRTIYDIVSLMEHPSIEDRLRVPIRCTYGTSSKSWFDADDEKRIPLDYTCKFLEHLR